MQGHLGVSVAGIKTQVNESQFQKLTRKEGLGWNLNPGGICLAQVTHSKAISVQTIYFTEITTATTENKSKTKALENVSVLKTLIISTNSLCSTEKKESKTKALENGTVLNDRISFFYSPCSQRINFSMLSTFSSEPEMCISPTMFSYYIYITRAKLEK